MGMSANEWAGIAVAVVTVVTGVAGVVRWMVKHYLHELVPNSGSSIKDKINRLESRVDEIYILLVERGK
jgi:hypothetical protein